MVASKRPNCVGVCQDRKVELVTVWDYADALSRLDQAIERDRMLGGFVAKLPRAAKRMKGFLRNATAVGPLTRSCTKRNRGMQPFGNHEAETVNRLRMVLFTE